MGQGPGKISKHYKENDVPADSWIVTVWLIEARGLLKGLSGDIGGLAVRSALHCVLEADRSILGRILVDITAQ